jgi:hypothetical protein
VFMQQMFSWLIVWTVTVHMSRSTMCSISCMRYVLKRNRPSGTSHEDASDGDDEDDDDDDDDAARLLPEPAPVPVPVLLLFVALESADDPLDFPAAGIGELPLLMPLSLLRVVRSALNVVPSDDALAPREFILISDELSVAVAVAEAATECGAVCETESGITGRATTITTPEVLSGFLAVEAALAVEVELRANFGASSGV